MLLSSDGSRRLLPRSPDSASEASHESSLSDWSEVAGLLGGFRDLREAPVDLDDCFDFAFPLLPLFSLCLDFLSSSSSSSCSYKARSLSASRDADLLLPLAALDDILVSCRPSSSRCNSDSVSNMRATMPCRGDETDSSAMLRRALSLSARFCSGHVCNSIIRRGRLAVLSQRWNAASAAHSGRPAKQSGLQADMLSMGSKSTFDDNDAELIADERAKGGTASARKEKLQQAAEDLVEETDATTDPGIIFETAFSSIEQKIGRENMVFPKEIIFVSAP